VIAEAVSEYTVLAWNSILLKVGLGAVDADNLYHAQSWAAGPHRVWVNLSELALNRW
jgi:hypothetical protein